MYYHIRPHINCFLNPKTGFWPHSQSWRNLCPNLSILCTFGPILGKSTFCTQKLDFGHPPRIGKICDRIYGFWTLLGRSWENLFFELKNLIFANHPESDRSCLCFSAVADQPKALWIYIYIYIYI